MKRQTNRLWILAMAIIIVGGLPLQAQQAPDPTEDIFEQMEQMMQEFAQGSFLQMDSMMIDGFDFQGQMDSMGMGMGSMPGFFFSDTLMMNPHGMGEGMEMDLQGLMEELTKSLESIDPAYLQQMEDLMRQFKSNGILPEEGFEGPQTQPKKKKKVYKT